MFRILLRGRFLTGIFLFLICGWAIARIDAGDYGWCEETGEAIGIQRLLARPTATLSIKAQQRRELHQKHFGN